MTENQLKELYLDTEHGTFTPNYTYDDFILNEETGEYEYIGLVIHKTAQEVYEEWLENKDKPVEPPVDQMEILSSEVEKLKAENKLLNAQVEALSATTDFQEDCLAEMAMLVYA